MKTVLFLALCLVMGCGGKVVQDDAPDATSCSPDDVSYTCQFCVDYGCPQINVGMCQIGIAKYIGMFNCVHQPVVHKFCPTCENMSPWEPMPEGCAECAEQHIDCSFDCFAE